MHWTAPPAVPLVRLSRAATATSRPAARSTATWTCTVLAPEDRLGLRPLARRQQVDERLVGVGRGVDRVRLLGGRWTGSASGAVQVARMPRDIGTSTGVKETVGARGAAGGEVLHDLGGVPVHAADAVRAGRPHQLRAEQVRSSATGPAPEGPLAATTTTSSAVVSPPVTAGSRASVAVVG